MTSASTRQRTIGAAIVAASFVYLIHFVPRGWIAHDEGMLAQSAERALAGQLPHVGYEEPYTGGLTWVYAALFRLTGTELLHVRWLLYIVAIVAMCILYALLRRFLKPTAAAIATWVGLAWSFPNYFAGLPSWWLLLCALGCTWAIVRYVEDGRLRHVALAGVAAGSAVAIKQTGVYLPVAVVLTFLYWGTRSIDTPLSWRFAAATAAILSALGAAAIMGQRLLGAEGVYLFLPIAMCSATLLTIHHLPSAPAADVRSVRLWFVLFAAMLAPIAVLLAPYVINGRLHDFWIGAFVLPRKRLTFAALRMPSAASIVTGIPVIALLIPVPQSMFGARVRAVDAAMWVAAVVLPVMALWNGGVYQFIWQSTRAFAVLIPIAICHRLMKRQVPSATQASVLYGLAAVLAWMSMNQFPYAGPIYFLYVTPLAVIAGVALAASTNSLGRHPILPWTLMVLLFAVLSTHRAYVQQLGVLHLPRHFDTPLNLPRAHLRLEREDADMYQRTVALVQQHLQGGQLVAGPDTPELYYLTGTQNRSGRLFDFFSGSDSDPTAGGRDWEYGQVIVINHEPAFSPKMPPEMLAQLRREFPAGEQIDIFEVRWR